jgi:hypothetical protein
MFGYNYVIMFFSYSNELQKIEIEELKWRTRLSNHLNSKPQQYLKHISIIILCKKII